MADQIPDSAKSDMSWIDIAVLGQKRGVVIVDHAEGWADFIDELHFADVFDGDEPGHLEPGVFRWSGFTIGSWDEGDPCVAKGGTFTRAAPPAMDREAVAKVEAAWSEIMREFGHAFGDIGNGYYPEVEEMRSAVKALSTLSADAIRQGEGTSRPYSEWNEDDRDVLWWMLPVQSTPYLGSPLDLGFTVGAQLYNQFGDVIGKTEANVGGWPFSASDEANLVWSRLPATPATPASHASDGGEA